MSAPKQKHWNKLKRLGRYLLGKPRVVYSYFWQEPVNVLTTNTDSDWAGDRLRAKSTSGGVVRWGGHVVKTWSSTQTTIALSSGEAELYALTKAAAQTLGLIALALDFGVKLQGLLRTDSTVAIGIVHRDGLGKTRHIRVQ